MPPPASSGGSQGRPAEHQWDDHLWRQGSHADAGAQASASASPAAWGPADPHSGYPSLAQARTSTNIGRNGAPRTSFQH
eukprot:7328680-Heterocapsa_arctica.AAC.1